MKWNIRHLRVFLSVTRHASVSRAADECHLSQPAVTQAIAKLERALPLPLFDHRAQGLFPTTAGEALARRVNRALGRIDTAAAPISPRLATTVTAAQLEALIAVRELENFTLAARHLGLAQPTVHRAVAQIESETPRPLFERGSTGLRATHACRTFADAARLAFAELDQAVMELAEMAGTETGEIVVGAMPLSRSYLLSDAIISFRTQHPRILLRVEEGPYPDLLSGLRRGEIDFLIGALRDPRPVSDIAQTPLFSDDLIPVVGPDHPLAAIKTTTPEALDGFPWVLPRRGSPARQIFDQVLANRLQPDSLVETSSMILMRQLLLKSDHIGFISRLQVTAEIELGLLIPLSLPLGTTERPIGLTTREGWLPTTTQKNLIDAVYRAAEQ